jgi:hypothetical protein
MATITSASIFPAFRRGLRSIIGQYAQYPDQWKAIYKLENSDQAYELDDEYKGFGSAQIKYEGQGIAQDNLAVRYQLTTRHITWGLSFSISEEAYDDNLYKKEFPIRGEQLKTSLRHAKNQNGANVFNLGAVNLTSDGVPLFSTAHPIDDGSVCSNYIGAALSETSLQNGVIAIGNFKELSGLKTMQQPKKLLVGLANSFAADILLHTPYKASIGNVIAPNAVGAAQGANDISAIHHMSLFPGGYIVDNFLTSPTFAAILTDFPRAFVHYDRKTISIREWVDQQTHDLCFSATERYSFAATNWRGVCALSL